MTMYSALPLMILTLLITIMSKLISHKEKNKKNKTPFECGFSKMINMNKFPLSVQFFMLSIMFIIFDIEISILISMVLPMKNWKISEWGMPSLIFLLTMILGITYEWNESAMHWTK